jgi:hypothetical protein
MYDSQLFFIFKSIPTSKPFLNIVTNALTLFFFMFGGIIGVNMKLHGAESFLRS